MAVKFELQKEVLQPKRLQELESGTATESDCDSVISGEPNSPLRECRDSPRWVWQVSSVIVEMCSFSQDVHTVNCGGICGIYILRPKFLLYSVLRPKFLLYTA